MCGISGFSASTRERFDARALTASLLRQIESRGRHATGVSFFEGRDNFVMKSATPASRFVAHLDLGADVRTAIHHTRFATQGSPKNNLNNHPIDVGGIVGVHNGCLSNDDDIFAALGTPRLAQVDSEAAFALLRHGDDTPERLLPRLRGSFALAWFDSHGDPDLLHLARGAFSPLHLATTIDGTLIFASTRSAISAAARTSGMTIRTHHPEVPSGTYLQVRDGAIIAEARFTPGRNATGMTDDERAALLFS